MTVTKTMKLHLHPAEEAVSSFEEMTFQYAEACNFISEYIFNTGFEMNFMRIQERIYSAVRERYSLKSQLAISAIKTVTARYQTVKEQLFQKTSSGFGAWS